MGFDFRKYLPRGWKYRMPENFGWETHHLTLYNEIKEKVAKGELPPSALQDHFENYKETDDQREWRWRRYWILNEIQEDNIKKFDQFRENPKAFLKRMADMGKAVSRWWWTRPKKMAGTLGRMIQRLDGSWQQEYKPSKSMNMKDWLQAADNGQAFKNSRKFSGEFLRKYKAPTEDMVGKSNEAKKIRKRQEWNAILDATNNFGRGWQTTDRSRPGLGGGVPREHRITFSDSRVYGKKK